MTTQTSAKEQDFPLTPVPMDQRKSVWSMGLVLLGFTFFTATMWAGGSIGVAFDFSTMLMVLLIGNLLLGTYAAILGYIAAKSGLNTALMSRFTFGEWAASFQISFSVLLKLVGTLGEPQPWPFC